MRAISTSVSLTSTKKPVLTFEVRDAENGSTRFGSSSLKFRRVNLDETLSVEVVSEKVSDTRLDLEDSLVGDCLKEARSAREVV
jgi:hypothetical protein